MSKNEMTRRAPDVVKEGFGCMFLCRQGEEGKNTCFWEASGSTLKYHDDENARPRAGKNSKVGKQCSRYIDALDF
jgi:hypothetical protein